MKVVKINKVDSVLADKLSKLSPVVKKSMLPFLIKAVGLVFALKILFRDGKKENKKYNSGTKLK